MQEEIDELINKSIDTILEREEKRDQFRSRRGIGAGSPGRRDGSLALPHLETSADKENFSTRKFCHRRSNSAAEVSLTSSLSRCGFRKNLGKSDCHLGSVNRGRERDGGSADRIGYSERESISKHQFLSNATSYESLYSKKQEASEPSPILSSEQSQRCDEKSFIATPPIRNANFGGAKGAFRCSLCEEQGLFSLRGYQKACVLLESEPFKEKVIEPRGVSSIHVTKNENSHDNWQFSC